MKYYESYYKRRQPFRRHKRNGNTREIKGKTHSASTVNWVNPVSKPKHYDEDIPWVGSIDTREKHLRGHKYNPPTKKRTSWHKKAFNTILAGGHAVYKAAADKYGGPIKWNKRHYKLLHRTSYLNEF